MRSQVAIVGAGPAGLTLARLLEVQTQHLEDEHADRCPEAVSVIEPLYDTADDQSRAGGSAAERFDPDLLDEFRANGESEWRGCAAVASV